MRKAKRILILGGTGFIGINLTYQLLADPENKITVFGRSMEKYPSDLLNHKQIHIVQGDYSVEYDFDSLTKGQEMVFHLISTTVPTTSNKNIAKEITDNIESTSFLLESCVKNHVKKFLFVSSGGTVYGVTENAQINEDTPTDPITSYGMQKLSIEKLLYLYYCIHELDYRIIRLANPYGPYQKVNGVQGVVAAFLYRILKGEEITVYGDGSVIRDYIYIEDAVKAILNISYGDSKYRIYNVGSGCGLSLNGIISSIENLLHVQANVKYISGRKVDVPVNILDVSRYEMEFGTIKNVDFATGLERMVKFMKEHNLDEHAKREGGESG